MGKFEDFLDKAKDLAEDAGDAAKTIAGDVADKVRELSDENSKVRDLKKSAKEQASNLALGAKEKVQGVLQDTKAGKEIKQGLNELETLPELEGSILYRMEYETAVNSLNSLLLIINDKRLDNASVMEEVKKTVDKLRPTAAPQSDEAVSQGADEDHAIAKVKMIAYSACVRAMGVLNE